LLGQKKKVTWGRMGEKGPFSIQPVQENLVTFRPVEKEMKEQKRTEKFHIAGWGNSISKGQKKKSLHQDVSKRICGPSAEGKKYHLITKEGGVSNLRKKTKKKEEKRSADQRV